MITIVHFSGMLSHDTRLRCDLVDLYYKLYGVKHPTCIPIPGLAGILKPQKVHNFVEEELRRPQYDPKPIPKLKEERLTQVAPMEIKEEPTDVWETRTIIKQPPAATLDEVCVTETKIVTYIGGNSVSKQEYFSDNSVSLPGMGQTGPVGFEPGMFKKEGDGKHKGDPTKVKKKKKDKKKHKHKHKHKHEHKHKDKKEKDPTKKLIKEEETLSSVSSTPSPNPISLGQTDIL